MKEFIEKLIAKMEEIPTKNKCSECPHKQKCDEIEAMDKDEQVDLCGATIKSLAIDAVKEIAEEYKNTNIITEFLQYARDNADNYDTNEGWSLADLIDLSIKYSEEYINTSTDTSSGWIPCSERLPEMPKENPLFEYKPLEVYLVSLSSTDYPWRAFWNGKYFTDGFSKVEPIAWMPLPAPYKEGGE